MAATYTEVPLEDMEKFLKRAYRALRPKQGVQSGEYYYDLSLSPDVAIRVWTSVRRGSDTGAGVGEDAIRIQLMGVPVHRPLMKGKAPIVKRTQGWRNSLQNKVEDLIETYEDKADYWEARANGKAAPAQEEPQEDRNERPPSAPPAPAKQDLTGSWVNWKGEWAIKVNGHASPGDVVMTMTKGGKKARKTLISKIWSGSDRYSGGAYAEIWSVDQSRTASGPDTSYNYDYS